jgi:Asp-tRNA(Asn)/Glu-tRNA(Gln) amidotransferase A subunit family amidase
MTSQLPKSLLTLSEELRSGQLPLMRFLDQLEAWFEQREPEVLAFLPEAGRFARLRQEARELLAQYPASEQRPFLFGVPVGIKDIFHVSGFVTRAGSSLPEAKLQGPEAPSVSALRDAGALILGKSVTTEFAYFAPGPTRNPHSPGHTPGGSSSGSAAAVGAGLCHLALGTQTIGSVNRPASFCGVAGYKPSYNRISKEGVIPVSDSADHVGFFTPRVSDMAPVAGIMCLNWDEIVNDTQPVLGIPDGPYMDQTSAEGIAHFQMTCQRLDAAGFTVKSVAAMADFEEIYERHNLLVAAEAAQVHAAWYAEYAGDYHAKTADLIERGKQVSHDQLQSARQGQMKLRQQLTQLMDENGLDLWISPAAVGPAPAGLDSTGDPVMNLPWTHAGLPTVSIPSGTNQTGLPLGLQIIARWYEDERLLAWSENLEKTLSN